MLLKIQTGMPNVNMPKATNNNPQSIKAKSASADSVSFSGKIPKLKPVMKEEFAQLYKELDGLFKSTPSGSKMTQKMGEGKVISIYPTDMYEMPVYACAISSGKNVNTYQNLEIRFMIRKKGLVDVQNLSKNHPNTLVNNKAEANLLLDAVYSVIKKQAGNLIETPKIPRPVVGELEETAKATKKVIKKSKLQSSQTNVQMAEPPKQRKLNFFLSFLNNIRKR